MKIELKNPLEDRQWRRYVINSFQSPPCRPAVWALWAMVFMFLSLLPCRATTWYVGNTAAGEWIQYTNVWLASGTYRFTANAAATAGSAKIHLEIDGAAQSSVTVPVTGRADAFTYVRMGSVTVSQGTHTIRVVFESAGISLDWFMLRKDTDSSASVKTSDYTMVRPPTNGMLLAPVTAFEAMTAHDSLFTSANGSLFLSIPERDQNNNPYSDTQLSSYYSVPMYVDWDRRTDRFWDVMVEQLMASRAQVPLIHCRATEDFTSDLQDRDYTVGAGSYEGRWLKKFNEAVARNPQASSALQIGMFWENGGIADGYYGKNGVYPAWGDTAFADYCMQYWLQPWFDNVPSSLLFKPNGTNPLISVYSGNPSHVVRDGKMGLFLTNICSRLQARYGFTPTFILPMDADSSALPLAWGQAPWPTWDPPMLRTAQFAGTYWGSTTVGSRRRLDTAWLNDWNPVTQVGTPSPSDSPGVDSHQSHLDTNGNSVLLANANTAKNLPARLIQEEGFYNISEGNAIFRSCAAEWKFPNQHMAAMRQYADPNTDSLLFEAEGCDSYYKTSTHPNLGGTYRCQWYSATGLDVYRPLHALNSRVNKNAGPGNLADLSAGFYDVWALDSNGQLWSHGIGENSADVWNSVSMDGIARFNCLSVSKAFAWAINGTSVYCCKIPYGWPKNAHTSWTLQSGSMVHLSANEADVWAVNSSGQIFRRPVHAIVVTTNSWTQVSGPALTKVFTGGNRNFVWGMNGNTIYFTHVDNISWTQVANPNSLTNLTVGNDEVWGINASGNVYRMSSSGVGSWESVSGTCAKIALGENYAWGLSGTTPFIQKLTGFYQPPATPSGLAATAGDTQVTLTWVQSPGATSYNVKRSTTSGGPYTTIASPTTTTYLNTGLTNGTAYYYVVSAVISGFESANSSEAAAVPGVLSRSGWIASCNTGGSDSPANAIDGNSSTRWSSGASQTNGQWFQVDMGSAKSFNEIVLESEASSGDYPRGYQVNVSNDGSNWGSPVATGSGSSAVTVITIATQTARFIRVTQTSSGSTGNWWSIHEFYVYGAGTAIPAAPTNLNPVGGNSQVTLSWTASSGATSYNVKRATTNGGPYSVIASGVTSLSYTNTGLVNGTPYFYVVSAVNGGGESADCPQVCSAPGGLSRSGWIATASSTEGGGSPTNAIDGYVSTRWATGASQTNGQWFQVDMGSAKTFSQVILECIGSAGDYPRSYQVNVSNDGSNWGSAIASGSASSSVTVISFGTQTARYIRVTQTSSGSTGNYWSIHEFNVYGSLPSPWLNQDIGSVGLAGSSSYLNSTFTVNGSGSDIQGTADALQYAYQSSSGDCSIQAKVQSVQVTDPWAKAGVMIREATTVGAINATVLVTPSCGITFQWRSSTGGGTTYATVGGAAPYWVKLTRTGNAFAAYSSPDGTTWTQVGTNQTFTMATSATIGMAVCAHNNTNVCSATFTNVTATP